MIRRLAVLAVLAACAALLAFACWPRTAVLPASPAPMATPPAAAGPVDPSTAEAPPSATAPRAPAAAAASERTEVATGDAAARTLAHDPAFVWIAVRNAEERPVAGAPVGLRVDEDGRSLLRWRGSTEASGRVRAPNVTTLPDARNATAWAMLALPLARTEGVAIERDRPPRDEIVLHLPPTGGVDVAIENDATAGLGADVRLRLFADPGVGGAFVADAHAPVEGGHARFQLVGLGLRLEAEATRPGQNEPSRLVFDGPRAPAQLVFVRLPLVPRGGTMIVAHVEDEGGTPVRDTRLDYTIDSHVEHSNSSSNSSVTTDGDGVLRLVLDDQLGADALRKLSLRLSPPNGDVQTCRVELPRPLRPGENDLGVLRLLRPPLVCAGVIVDGGGAGIAGANVRVQGKVNGRKQETWRDERGLQATTTVDGAFEVRGAAESAELRAEVGAAGYLPTTSTSFAPATTGLRIGLARAAALAGSVVLRPPLEVADVLVELRRGEHREPARLSKREDRGLFEFASQAPGMVEVCVRAIGDARGELRVPDVVLNEGETVRDPRLQDVDLLRGLSGIAFTVVDDQQTPLRDAEVFVLDGTPEQTRFEGLILPHGNGRLLTHGGSVDVLAIAPGYAWARATLTDGAVLTLPPVCRVHLQLPADAVLQPGETLVAQLTPLETLLGEIGEYVLYGGLYATRSGNGTLPWATGGMARASSGEVVAEIDRPGRYRLTWTLARSNGPARVAGGPRELTVPPLSATTVDGGLSAADLEAARRR